MGHLGIETIETANFIPNEADWWLTKLDWRNTQSSIVERQWGHDLIATERTQWVRKDYEWDDVHRQPGAVASVGDQ